MVSNMKKTNLDSLKKQFDKVYLKHIRSEDFKTATTIGILVKDGTVFVGVSKCHEGDQFSREIGRNISLGRALDMVDKVLPKGKNQFKLALSNEDGETLMAQVEAIVTSSENL